MFFLTLDLPLSYLLPIPLSFSLSPILFLSSRLLAEDLFTASFCYSKAQT
jgi:hypothetical protein